MKKQIRLLVKGDKSFTDVHYHSSAKKCKIINLNKKSSGTGMVAAKMFCETHQIRVCKCGWEFGWHYGKKALRSDWQASRL